MPERDISSLGAMGLGGGDVRKFLPPSPPSPLPSEKAKIMMFRENQQSVMFVENIV